MMNNTPICLLIDDDDDDEDIFRSALKELNGHIQCIVAKDERQAFEILEHTNDLPDLIFLDLHLHQTSGIECLFKIKKMPYLSHIPVYIYTSVADAKLEMESHKLGAAGFIRKPNSIQVLKETLHHILSELAIRH